MAPPKRSRCAWPEPSCALRGLPAALPCRPPGRPTDASRDQPRRRRRRHVISSARPYRPPRHTAGSSRAHASRRVLRTLPAPNFSPTCLSRVQDLTASAVGASLLMPVHRCRRQSRDSARPRRRRGEGCRAHVPVSTAPSPSPGRRARSTSTVRLPSRRSDVRLLPVTAGSPNRPRTSSRIWKAVPMASP